MLIIVIFKKSREHIINDVIVVYGCIYKQPFGGNFGVTANIYGAN